MSINSNSSVSFQDLFGKMKSNNKPVTETVTKPAKPTVSAEYSQGIRQVNTKGYEVYNVSDVGEIFIAKAPESAFFNDGEDMIVKAESGKMVGLYRPKTDVKIEAVNTSLKIPATIMFGNVKRGSDSKIDAFTGTYNNGIMKRKPAEIR